ncbi:MAG TPA: type II toxin-antitoxin system PemK/MazF family toxin [Acidiferrobacterales bacterium]|jgi:mRNA interferase MazF
MKRGEVWVANLNPGRGAGVGKIRPVVVMQSDRLTDAGLPTVLVIPLTTQLRPALEPVRVTIAARDRLEQDCHAMVEQLRALDRRRLGEGPLTRLTAEEMRAIERSVIALLGMY